MNIRDILNMLQYLWGVVPLRLFVPYFAKKALNYSVLLSVLQKFSVLKVIQKIDIVIYKQCGGKQ